MVAKYEKHTLERMKEDLIVVPRNAGIRSSFLAFYHVLTIKRATIYVMTVYNMNI